MSEVIVNRGNILEVDLCGRVWTIERLTDLETLWSSIGLNDFDDEERIPYWTEIWPSSVTLARHISLCSGDIAGRACLDLGCGLGLTACIASGLGARVVGLDNELQALGYAVMNAQRNNVGQPLWTLGDWSNPPFRPGCFSYIWGGDVIYEKRFFAPLLELFRGCLAPGGAVWLATPDRTVNLEVLQMFRDKGWTTDRLVCELVPVESYTVRITLWELRPGR